MRIIGGMLGGRRLAGGDLSGLRPTTDRVREALFNILAARTDFEGKRGLNLFAGAGALGIEALSRGVEVCDFVEKRPRTADLIRRNLNDLGLAERGRVHVRDALKYLGDGTGQDPYDFIFADPPYAASFLNDLARLVAASGLLHPDGFFVLEHSGVFRMMPVRGLDVVAERAFGDSAITVMRRSPGDSGEASATPSTTDPSAT